MNMEPIAISNETSNEELFYVMFWKYSELRSVPSIWQDLLWSMHLPVTLACLIFTFVAMQSAAVYKRLTRPPGQGYSKDDSTLNEPVSVYKHLSMTSQVKEIPCSQHKVEFDVGMDTGRQKFLQKLREVVHF